MAIKRYWRLVGVATPANGDLELSELRLYEGGGVVDTGATLTATLPPTSGTLADLRDGSVAGVVSWPHVNYSAPGFALVWDFGVGGGAETLSVQLGSGTSEWTFPNAATMQSSSDGISWGAAPFYVNFVYPGDSTLGSPGSGAGDIYADDVALLVPFNSPTVVSIASRVSATLTLAGGASITSAHSKYGGSSLEISSVTGKIDVLTSREIDLTGTYTIEAWVRIASQSTTDANCVITTNDNTLPNRYRVDYYTDTSSSIVGRVSGVSNSPVYTSSSKPYVLGTWAHIAYVNDTSTNTFKIFIDGALAGSRAAVPLFKSDTFQIGKGSSVWAEPPCQLDDLRITTGVARYTSAFTPPDAFFLSVAQKAIVRAVRMQPPVMYVGSLLPVGAARGHMREYTFFDAYNGGVGTIVGTVKEKNTPANTPLHRRVLLVDEASRIVIRETWSDPITGAFEFRGVKQGVKYSTISYDHLHNYRAVIADNQDAA